MKFFLVCLSIGLLVSGCTLTTFEYQSNLRMEENYLHASAQRQTIDSAWWKEFGSETLNSLVAQMLERNHDLLSSYETLKQAQLQLHVSKTALSPSATLSASSAAKRNISDIDRPDWKTTRSSGATLGISYEIDVWNKLEASVKASEATLKATQYDWDALRLSLIANTVESYLQYVALEERIVIARQNLESARELLKIVEAKYEAGSVSEVDVSQQKTTLLSQESTLLGLQQSQQESFHAIAILCGEKPEVFGMRKEPFNTFAIQEIQTALPSDLLLNRPDIASSRAQIESAEYAIYVAYVERFPSFSLTGSAGLASDVLASLANPSAALNGALGLGYTLFDNGKADDQLSIEKSKAKKLVIAYEQTVLTALQEVEDALFALHIANQKSQVQEQLLQESERSYRLALDQYTYGSTDFATLIGAQRTLYQVKDATVQQKLTKLLATVDMYKVLGGGWTQ